MSNVIGQFIVCFGIIFQLCLIWQLCEANSDLKQKIKELEGKNEKKC